MVRQMVAHAVTLEVIRREEQVRETMQNGVSTDDDDDDDDGTHSDQLIEAGFRRADGYVYAYAYAYARACCGVPGAHACCSSAHACRPPSIAADA